MTVQMELGGLFSTQPGDSPDEGGSGQAIAPEKRPEVIVGHWESPLGTIRAACRSGSVIWLSFVDGDRTPSAADLGKKWNAAAREDECEVLDRLWGELEAYFAGTLKEFLSPVSFMGTPFQQSVWAALMEIPYGQTMSYTDLAEKVGIKFGQRAVGKANGDNPVSLLVPCHRVVRADGDLCGYAGGIWRKQQLLGLESGQKLLF